MTKACDSILLPLSPSTSKQLVERTYFMNLLLGNPRSPVRDLCPQKGTSPTEAGGSSSPSKPMLKSDACEATLGMMESLREMPVVPKSLAIPGRAVASATVASRPHGVALGFEEDGESGVGLRAPYASRDTYE
eukprot:scaffold183500_cov28-Tisochrysis_lutea.AAC.1